MRIRSTPEGRARTSHGPLRPLLLAGLLLAAHAHAVAQRFSETSPEATRETYFWIKRQVSENFSRLYSTIVVARNEPFDFPEFRLNWMDMDAGSSIHGLARDDLMHVLAIDVISLREIVQRAGYPKAVWGDPLIAFEDKYMRAIANQPPALHVIKQCVNPSRNESVRFDEILALPESNALNRTDDLRARIDDCGHRDSPLVEAMDSDMQKIFAVVADYEKSHRGQVTPIDSLNEIGGTVPATLVLDWSPTRGILRVIPSFYYRLCQFRKVDPEDPGKCPNWADVSGDELEGAGNYNFNARWPDGRTRSGQVAVTFEATGKHWRISP